MSRDEQERLRDIKDAIVTIRRHLANADATAASKEDPLLHDALLFQFVVVGEAVKHLTPETREAAPEIPWTDIAGLRDLIAHEYFRIEVHRVLEIVERDLPPLEQAISRLIED
jgi:uncharacterized protein with HEPN domain